MDIFNELLEHPYINKSALASDMMPDKERKQAQVALAVRRHRDGDFSEEQISRTLPTLVKLEAVIKKIKKKHQRAS